jgi:hypothetical protein
MHLNTADLFHSAEPTCAKRKCYVSLAHCARPVTAKRESDHQACLVRFAPAMRVAVALLMLALICVSCHRAVPEPTPTHRDRGFTPSSMAGDVFFVSTYNVVKREVHEDQSGKYVVVTLKHEDQLITAECFTAWRGYQEWLRPDPLDDCSDFPLGPVELVSPDGSASTLYYYPKGKITENVLETRR